MIYRSFLAVFFPLLIVILSVVFAMPEIGGKAKAAARAGDADAQYELARMYFDGIDVPQDAAKGIKWTAEAAENGNPYAQLTLGIIDRKSVV